MKLYVNIRLPRKDPVLFIDIDLKKEACRMYLKEKCPICAGHGCTTDCRENYPNAIPAADDGSVITLIKGENIREVLGNDTMDLIKDLLKDSIMSR